mmetsp:Transcript_41240/g.119226  ORF Transcript_41240/g.119226 Transcript_41240/m.119226 type:complete len:339 (-) Transcript_41240:138-1154(-)
MPSQPRGTSLRLAAAAAGLLPGSTPQCRAMGASEAAVTADWASDRGSAWRRQVGDPVASTARWIAAQRAQEHRRHDHMFEDRFAEVLAGEEGFDFRGGAAPIAVSRTRFMDDVVLESCQQRGVRQVVNLGAGMDTRAVRLAFPEGVTYFELDKPALFDVKEPLLQPLLRPEERALCNRVVIPVDFEHPPQQYRNAPEAYWADLLHKHGFDPAVPSCWVLEGLTYYLPGEVNQQIFRRIAKLSAPGSTVVFDMVNGNFMRQEHGGWHLEDLRARGCPWKWGHNDPAGLLSGLGFQAEVLDLRDLEVDRRGRRLAVRRATERRVERSSQALTFYVTAVRV